MGATFEASLGGDAHPADGWLGRPTPHRHHEPPHFVILCLPLSERRTEGLDRRGRGRRLVVSAGARTRRDVVSCCGRQEGPSEHQPSPGRGPALCRRMLDRRGLSGLSERTLVPVSELMTNAVTHGRGRIGLTLSASGERLHVAVANEGRSTPVMRRPDPSTRSLAAGVCTWSTHSPTTGASTPRIIRQSSGLNTGSHNPQRPIGDSQNRTPEANWVGFGLVAGHTCPW